MRCVNCGFNNMPGSDGCVRCGSSLAIAVAVIDVHPPRAGRASKRLRWLTPLFRRSYYAMRDAGAASTIPDRAKQATALMPPASVFLRLAIPGWSHFYQRQPIRGHLYLWSFLLFLVPGLLLFGSTWGSIWIGMAFSVHSSAALDIVMQHFADAGMRDRIARSIIVSVMLWVLLYLPTAIGLGYIANPCTLMTAIGPFQANDVLLVNGLAKPRRGTMAIYQSPFTSTTQTTFYREHMITIFTGQTIDRILAIPGDHVQCLNSQLLVNGSPSKYQPLARVHLPEKLDITIPPDRYLLISSATPGASGYNDAANWSNGFCISRDNIVGSVYWRSSPMGHLGIIR